MIAISDGDDNDSGDDFDVHFNLTHCSELFSSSCANVLLVSSFGIAVDKVVLSLRLYISYVQNNNGNVIMTVKHGMYVIMYKIAFERPRKEKKTIE